MSEQKNSSQKLLLILVFLLLGTNILTLYWWKTSDNTKTVIITEKEQIVQDQELEIQQMKEELEGYKGKNAQLDSIIEVTQAELGKKKEDLGKLAKESKSSKKLIAKLKREISKLNLYRKQYMAQIDSLISANKILIAENENLKTDIKSEKEKSDKLTDENVRLFNKLAVGAILKADNIVPEGIKVKSSGREVSVSRARQAEKIKICFRVLENRVAESGPKVFMARIVGPDGATLYAEEAGSGKFELEGKETLYTTSTKVDYQNQDTNVCVYFSKGNDYLKGQYQVELYADGYVIGKSSFELK